MMTRIKKFSQKIEFIKKNQNLEKRMKKKYYKGEICLKVVKKK